MEKLWPLPPISKSFWQIDIASYALVAVYNPKIGDSFSIENG